MEHLTIREADFVDTAIIHQLAHETWWPTYQNLLPHDQIRFMLEEIYDVGALKRQMEAGQRFVLAEYGNRTLGFAGFRLKPTDENVMRIEKLYVHPTGQGQGGGRALISHIGSVAENAGCHTLELNVYRYNPAKEFYERLGFKVSEAVQIPFHGYTLNDFVMRKSLR